METNNFLKVMGIFLLGWSFSGFGLAQILGIGESSANKATIASLPTSVPLKVTLSLVNNADNSAVASGYRVEMAQCSLQKSNSGYNCQPTVDQTKNTLGNSRIKESQFTNADGKVTFTAIYPDKYSVATAHIHVMVFDRANNLISTSQLDYPTSVYKSVTEYYATGGTNPATEIANDATANPPMLVTGNPSAGYFASKTIFIPANADVLQQLESSDGEKEVSSLKNFPNPVVTATTFAFHLKQSSEVALIVVDGTGTQVTTVFTDNLVAGEHEIAVDLGGLQKGIYFYRLQVSNKNGTFNESKKLIKV